MGEDEPIENKYSLKMDCAPRYSVRLLTNCSVAEGFPQYSPESDLWEAFCTS
eukprot:m.176863 g.176863  ORF g.176863 m.176863 type:complete len:52 (+) comp39148_c0_seq29:420-575(+)